MDVANASSSSPVLQRFAIGFQWPTVDPFLFCVHHVDDYPAGNGRHGPAATLAGRDLGNDFAGIDGWRMYHGAEVPGFPQHPHRGFETVTYVRRGIVDHSDSLGAAARYGRGDVQWLTAGRGIVHSETFPLLDDAAPNPLELFQIWVNLPAADKMADPHFSMFWADDVPVVVERDDDDREVRVTVVAGRYGDMVPPSPPPRSWASRPEADLGIWHVQVGPGATWTLPPAAGEATVRTVYVFGDDALDIGGRAMPSGHAAVVRCDAPVAATSPSGTEVLVLQGRPIGEPVAQYGPFVLNDRAGIEQAFADYRATAFGGWPWANDEPVHAGQAGPSGRFARYPDGRLDEPRATDE